MRQADGDGIGGIGRRRDSEAEERADHEGDLGFLSSTASDHGLLHTAWGVFVDGEPVVGGGEQNRSPRRSQRYGGGETLHKDHAFHCHGDWVELLDRIAEPGVDFEEATGLR